MRKLCKLILENDDIKNIPLEYVVKVIAVVFEVINSGECFYEREEV